MNVRELCPNLHPRKLSIKLIPLTLIWVGVLGEREGKIIPLSETR